MPDPARLAGRLLLIAVAALVAARALQLGPGASGDPARVLRRDPGNPQAVLALARTTAETADSAGALRRAGLQPEMLRAALARAPLDGRLQRVRAELAGVDSAEGRVCLQRALRLRPADLRTRAWLADAANAAGDLAGAAQHVDAILRLAPQRAPQLFPLLHEWLRSDSGRAAVVAVLAPAPSWRRGFLASAPPQHEDLFALARLLLALRNAAVPATPAEGVVVVERLLALGDYPQAWLLWLALQPAAERSGPLLRNGDFERPPGGGFDWTLRRGDGAAATLAAAPGRDSRALRVRLDGRPAAAGATQIVLLPPGAYRLSGLAYADGAAASATAEWSVDCLAPRAQRLGTATPQPTPSWNPFALDFRVPERDCLAQRVQLNLRGARRDAGAELWFDALNLTTTGAEP
ncbi:MAG: hypothetical protein BGP24_10370 [Lysobacterales bacterium 69-70]|nr:hypothetical protein [Xanthomonadaceae bacterium]ODU33340.1 MAG: hypothetical protein ABS97_13390 [Xanthomonadaceae bacterium SCN 69-320]ODV18013.1 MAG: hypothetical protein ABT27_15360 [Xanthomonadaceae bacterium SCN 69-25]OJZ00883.1 MAG: hypothetical protein BGP24_10370 [Xanthomonadales bacterium 69-70]